MVRIFVKLEERNYSHLVYVNLLTRQTEQVKLMSRNLLSRKSESEFDEKEFAKKRAALLAEMQLQVDRLQSQIKEAQEEWERERADLEKVEKLVLQLASMLDEQNWLLIRQGNNNA